VEEGKGKERESEIGKKELGEVASQPNSTKVLGQKWFPKFSKLCTHYVHICADVEPTL
jgi:hypothetical protein